MDNNRKLLVVEIIIFVIRICASIVIAFVGKVFFFWPKKYKSVTNDVILITGGGKGIGRLIAVEFAKRKPKQIIIWDRHEDTLSATAKAVQLQGVACDYMLCDVADLQQVSVKAKEVKSRFGDVDVLVNNAGVVCGKPILEFEASEIRHTIDVNLMSQFWVENLAQGRSTVKAFLPCMLAKNHGHIVSINSLLGMMGIAGATDYCASKFGALGLHEALSLEVSRASRNGVFLTTVHPFQVDTDMFTGVATRFPSLFPPLNKDYVAWKVVNAVCTNQKFCIMPRSIHFLALLKWLLPYETIALIHQFLWLDTAMDGFQRHDKNKQI